MTNSNQSGRSMIEMLGVLAIIGVLSVGGIAGYSKAMMKFKINKTIDQVSQIVANTRTLYARQKDYRSISNKVMYKANLAPKEMFEDGSGSYGAVNSFGGDVEIGLSTKLSGSDMKAFAITYYGLPEEACIELATQDWGSDTSSGLIAIGVNSYDHTQVYLGCDGYFADGYAYACSGGSRVSTPMPVDLAVDSCNGGNNKIYFKFY